MFSVSAEAGILAFREDNRGKAEMAVGEVAMCRKWGMTQMRDCIISQPYERPVHCMQAGKASYFAYKGIQGMH